MLYRKQMTVVSRILFFLLLLCAAFVSHGQNILEKKISIDVKRKKVADVLKMAEEQGNFYFSYNNRIINEDSLVTISIKQKSVKALLDMLFGDAMQYIESNDHLIIQPAISVNYWYVSGYIVDINTGEPVSYATVFEQQQLVSTMTDEKGFFKLALKEKNPQTRISISKLSYKDTVISMPSTKPNDTKIGIQPKPYELDSIVISGVEHNRLAGLFISSKQAMNSLNLGNFFTKQPIQFSLTPGLGTHGSMSSQVINKFSLNLIGGYTAGVNGFELGLMFNILKGDMKYVQLAGFFNVVGGEIEGVQIAGLYNSGLKNMHGFQASAVTNIMMKDVEGVQVAGIYNLSRNLSGVQVAGTGSVNTQSLSGAQIGGTFNVSKNITGVQIAGNVNVNTHNVKGVQIAGNLNICKNEVNGMQIASMLNYAGKLKGVQIAAVNIADSSEGYSIGLFNLIIHGYHKLSVSSNEWQPVNIAYKSGNAKLYSILMVGTQLDSKQKAYSFGYGMGSDWKISKSFYLNPELSEQYVYNGDNTNQNILSRLQIHIKYRLSKYADIYAGPAVSILYSKQTAPIEGYKYDFSNGYPSFSISKQVTGWIGWSLGLDLF
jgi:hypothetical protein